jgi:HEAT repeat protein
MPLIRPPAAVPDAAPLPFDAATLRRQLGALDPVRRRAAAQALAGDPDAVPLLAAALEDEREQPVRSALLGALAAIGSEDAVCALADCLRSEDAWLRNAAIELLRGAPVQAARVMEGLMANLLVDPQRDVRILAIGILDTLRHERVEDWLLQLIEVDDDPNVCGAALDVLAQVGGEAAYGPVERLLARFEGEPFIGFAGKLLLGRLAQGPVQGSAQGSIQGSTHA